MFLLLPTSGSQSAEQSVAEEEGGNADEAKVSQGLEHGQLEEVAEIQAENRSEAEMKAEGAEGEVEVGDVRSELDPQRKEDEKRQEHQSGEEVRDGRRRAFLRLSEQMLYFRLLAIELITGRRRNRVILKGQLNVSKSP